MRKNRFKLRHAFAALCVERGGKFLPHQPGPNPFREQGLFVGP
jgi:hypothetical protein